MRTLDKAPVSESPFLWGGIRDQFAEWQGAKQKLAIAYDETTRNEIKTGMGFTYDRILDAVAEEFIRTQGSDDSVSALYNSFPRIPGVSGSNSTFSENFLTELAQRIARRAGELLKERASELRLV